MAFCDWSSDVCSSDLHQVEANLPGTLSARARHRSSATAARPRPCARSLEPRRASLTPQVDHAWCDDPPRLKTELNRAPEHQIRPSPVSPRAAPPRSRAPVTQRRRPARGMFPCRPIPSRRVRLEARTPLIRATRSGSDGQDPRVPLQPGSFAKETLSFLEINPPSWLVQK